MRDRVKPAPHPDGFARGALCHTDLAPGGLERWGALQAEALTMACKLGQTWCARTR